MEDIISKLIDGGMGNAMDKRTDELLKNDTRYGYACAKLSECEDKIKELNLSKHEMEIVDEYFGALDTANCRANDLCYMAGVRDTVLLLNQLGLLKGSEQK